MQRMKAYILFFLLIPTGLFAQEDTRGREKQEDDRYRIPDSVAKAPDSDRVVLIPYEPNRYHSDQDKVFMQETGLRARQVRKRIRFGLDQEILKALRKERMPISYVEENDPDRNFELKHVYRSLAYEYKPVPDEDLEAYYQGRQEEEDEEEKGFFKKAFGKDDKEERVSNAERDSGSGREAMEGGQIKSEPDRRIRFMNAQPRRRDIIEYLSRKYGAGYVVLINQLDLKTSKDDPVGLASGDHSNRIKVHFTILDHEGEELHGGAVFVDYPSSVNELNGLVKGYFPKVGEHIEGRLDELTQGDNGE